MESFEYIESNYQSLLSEIDLLAKKAGRDVTLVAVTKSGSDDELSALCKAGATNIGENRPGELRRRGDLLKAQGYTPILHEIGNLQRNKVKLIIEDVALIHSLDSLSLAEEIDKQAKRVGRVVPVLIEINSGREEQKGGVLPEDAEAFCNEIASFSSIRLRGFMTLAPKCDENSEYLKYFCETYQLVLDIWQKKLHNIDIPILSMGMSDSYAEAIMAGSTMVRVGRKMFNKKL